MFVNTLYGASPRDIKTYDNQRLREEFVVPDMFVADKVCLTYTHVDRMIVGGAQPVNETLEIASGEALGTETFFDAREMGIANLGGTGSIEVDGVRFTLEHRDVLYVGRGTTGIKLSSKASEKPANFYMNSVPAGEDLPAALIKEANAKPVVLGEEELSNKRTLRMYIHPEVSPSCLLLMGITEPASGSVWNTEPPHLHERRMEAYCYFNMAPEHRVMHFMGEPSEVRAIPIANLEGLISPAWSIHMGAGTGPYCFVWGMTGENKAYWDFTPVEVSELR
ncbi:5-dehydro-4-deoxy-D-glucuronate isomerase [Cohaesibacter celericrescens]|uniref:5-dehydro-4-deoxy-D-glucuronate isomerase n=1 Tax=Cohaesibacter celericrescens TaxID=2067669 RepID=A0A2N5XPR7_9HYPH|nr:5-dehydro-4-deoxy-D-glucuronate isomerase [Cohaesibacter celericrescens]PLW76521.1 5-dehydro-4-deoxy-D-glucuronate isomerase [Cohaesibacter celericrescens]